MEIVVVHVSYKLHPDFYVLLQFEIFHPIDHNGKDKSEGVWIFSETYVKNLSIKKLCSAAIYGCAKFHDDNTTFRIFKKDISKFHCRHGEYSSSITY